MIRVQLNLFDDVCRHKMFRLLNILALFVSFDSTPIDQDYNLTILDKRLYSLRGATSSFYIDLIKLL